jgi:aspartyl-tRNA(Asn)/glutamyl-tRNA(Gln) amidotransferase subunit B
MDIFEKYEAVIGLEVHAQLSTATKAYCSDKAEYGALPNTLVSAISLGHPGTLPMPNKKVVEFAVKLGLACQSEIRHENQYARKNYFYADLPKGYQITQDKTPICNGGFILIKDNEGNDKTINLIRIHMEEDAGKSIHDVDPYHTLVDLNRAGVALVEIVSAPDLRTPEEAYNYLSEVRRLVRYLEICDGNMEEGSLRCDANISVRLRGTDVLNTRVEIKNMNSMRNVQRAIEGEIKRQIEVYESGGTINQETRNYDAVKNSTMVLRSKEQANDYRYFPEPDIQPVMVEQEYIQKVKSTIPPLPRELFTKYTTELNLPEYDAGVLIEDKNTVLYFEALLAHTSKSKAASNWMMGPVKSYLNERAAGITEFPVKPETMAQLIDLVESNKVSFSSASQKIFPLLTEQPEKNPEAIAAELNLIQESDSNALEEFISKAISAYPDKVIEYKNGKKGLVGLFMGEVMKLSKGKADPKVANAMLVKKLEEAEA